MKMHLLMRDWQLQARVGLYPHEIETPQFIRIKLQLTLAKLPAGSMSESVDYDWLHKTIGELCMAKHYPMLEELAVEILNVLKTKSQISAAGMTLLKLHAFPDAKPGVKLEWDRKLD